MGSPGTFIHSGTLGGRLLVSVAAASELPASPLARAAPPIMALPRRKRRREVSIVSFSPSAGSGISILFRSSRFASGGSTQNADGVEIVNAFATDAHGSIPLAGAQRPVQKAAGTSATRPA